MGLDHGREQVVGRADRVDVAREVEVQVLHRHDLGVATAGGAALDPEDRPERGLAQAEHGPVTDVPEPCASETAVTVFPSPALVGVIAVTLISLPSSTSRRRSSTVRSTFAFVRPYGSTSFGSNPAAAAISSIGRSVAAWAISRLDGSAVVMPRP